VDHLPAGLWEALTALLGAATLYLGVLARAAKRQKAIERRQAPATIDYTQLREQLREFIDARATHKARNVVSTVMARLDRLEADVAGHLERTQEDVRKFYMITGQLTESVETLKENSVKNGEALTELVRMVARLEGAQDR